MRSYSISLLVIGLAVSCAVIKTNQTHGNGANLNDRDILATCIRQKSLSGKFERLNAFLEIISFGSNHFLVFIQFFAIWNRVPQPRIFIAK